MACDLDKKERLLKVSQVERDSDRKACFAGNWPQPSREDGAECLLRSAVGVACTGWVRGPGRGCRFFCLGAFQFPVMVLSVLPTGCPTDFGDKPLRDLSQ